MTNDEREGILEIISDMSKDATGCRVRLAYDDMDDDQLQSWYDYFAKSIERGIEEDRQAEVRNVARWEAHIARMIELGAGDRATAIRWDMEANCAHDVDHYCYQCGLPFRMAHEIVDYRRAA
jgi:hypothetical protein